ncbi:hypothetical protein BDN71DRAFT_1442699 [Pleurotus eryngii]|uniref:Uncharacterized protein n=1 Tax=Pleurotus eryngii TaxID=5323 RepID=A0A9P5ZWJ9_PLEER|nr:hypothetical protein BDN71DRAFT_1449476 [Pleurotus eryngii]KAF9498767.1 hypothetical protein BDN71DRAFT_1442699 [Pleurotus eryngii]
MGQIPDPIFIHPRGLYLRADPNSYTMRRVLKSHKSSSMSIREMLLLTRSFL